MKEFFRSVCARIYSELDSLHQKYYVNKLDGQSGATTVEYALLIAVIVTMVIAAATFMYDDLKQFFIDVVKKISDMAKGTTAKPKF